MTTDHKPIYGYYQYPHMDFLLRNNPKMDIAKTIGANLTALMGATKDLNTCKKVAEKSHVGFGTVQRAKNGEGNITVEKLAAVAAVFRKHPADLLIDGNTEYAVQNNRKATVLECNEPRKSAVLEFPTPLIRELLLIAENLNETGLNRLIERASQLAEDHPKQRSAKDASSQ